jgi:hypothetical protein
MCICWFYYTSLNIPLMKEYETYYVHAVHESKWRIKNTATMRNFELISVRCKGHTKCALN